MNFNVLTKRFTSRKFLMAVVAVLTGLIAIIKGETVAGCSLIGTAAVSYLAAEGYIDGQSAKSIIVASSDVAGAVSELTDNKIDDRVAEVIFAMGEQFKNESTTGEIDE